MMSDNVRGVERIRNPRPMEDDVLVHDNDGHEWTIPESKYLERKHEPPLEDLPWRQ